MVLSIMLYVCETKEVLESVVLMNECTLLVNLRDCVRMKQVNRMSVEDLKPGMRDRVKILSGLAQEQCACDISFHDVVNPISYKYKLMQDATNSPIKQKLFE